MNLNNLRTSLLSNVPAKAKYIALGVAVALVLVSLLLVKKKEAPPECGNLWMINPLIIVPLSGSVNG